MSQRNDLGAIIISIIATLAFAGVLGAWFFKPPTMDATSSAVLNVLVGALSAGYLQTLNYWFGSSSGSKDKDKTIANLSSPTPP